jgi:uncharacterized protein YecE (DUF72 family)
MRLHGRNATSWFRTEAERDEKYDYLYDRSELTEIAQRARRIATGHDQTTVITNNHFSGKGIANAIELLYLLDGVPPLAPPELVESFPELRAITRIEGQQSLF